jgi:hypothetical protein
MTRQKAETAFGAPRERPILFSAPMVRAILDGRKTQTRRVLKFPRFIVNALDQEELVEALNKAKTKAVVERGPCDGVKNRYSCPYGQPGDRLWVREAWSTHAIFDPLPPRDITARSVHYWADGDAQTGKRRPGMFLPRWASRITLEVTGVRVERLRDISEKDAEAEGCPLDRLLARDWYSQLWESINGPGSWDANPWVWVVAFKRIEAPQGIPGAPHGG